MPASLRSHHAREHPELLASPPCARAALRVEIGEPVLPPHRAHQAWRAGSKWVASEQSQHARTVLEQTLLREHHPARLLPWTERGEPEIPVEARLVWRVDP